MHIRPLNPEDFFWLKDYDCRPLNLERDSIYLLFCVHFQRTCFVSVDEEGAPVGFVLGFLPSGATTAYVHYLFVAERYRRNGLGRRLMDAFIGSVSSCGAQDVVLFTIRAIAFYSELGFKPDASPFPASLSAYVRDKKGATIMRLSW